MDVTRVRFGSLVEWLLAAACIAGAAYAAGAASHELRTVRPVVPVHASAPTADDVPSGLPPGSISVPVLLLDGGREIRLGDRASDVTHRLGQAVNLISESLDREHVRQRLTRFYEELGVRFVVVYDAHERNDLRVAAIYLP